MPDLEDFELERTRGAEGTSSPYPPEPPERRRGGLLFPAILALAAVVAVGLLAVLFLVFRSPETPHSETSPPPSVPAPSLTPAASPSATPEIVLPPLDESDDFVRQLAGTLSGHPEFIRWLARRGLVRTFTVVTVNIAAGESPRPHILFLAPKQRFTVQRRGGTLLPEPSGYAGYDIIGDAVVSLDAAACARAYRMSEPLFEVAFEDFGQPGVPFRSVLDRAIAALLAAPVPREDTELVAHATVFRYADPRLERLTPAQKQLLRMGPRNVRRVQAKLGEIAAALQLPSGRSRSPSRPD